jgi:hypothetical protein
MTRAVRGRGQTLALSGLFALLLLAGAMVPPSLAPAAAQDAQTVAGDADTETDLASPEERLTALEQQVEGLDQGGKTLTEQLESNRDAIAQQAERLDAELKRIDPMALRLDSLAQQLEQLQSLVEEHETRIEDNSVKLYETLMGIDDTGQAMTALRAQVQRLEQRAQAAATPARTAEDAAEPGAGRSVASLDVGTQGFLPAFALGLLLPVGILLYAAARTAAADAATAAMPAAALLLALTGAALGFLLLGIGIRDGDSLGGLVGAPFEFLPALLRLAPNAGVPDIAETLLTALPLLVAMALLAVVTAGGRLTAAGGLLVGLVLGGLLMPLFGHWSFVPAGGEAPTAGWLARLGFADTGEVVAVALVGGGAALGLALGLRRDAAGVRERPDAEPVLLAAALLLLWIGWLAPRLAVGDAEAATALALLSWAAAIGATLSASLFGAVFRGGRERLQGLAAAVVAGVVAAPALGVDAGVLVALLFGALVGLLFALLAPLLSRRNPALELALAFTVAGLAAGLAPALAGPDGLLFLPVAEGLPVQLMGTAVALGLGLGGGLLLALGLRAMPGLVRRQAVGARAASAPAAA